MRVIPTLLVTALSVGLSSAAQAEAFCTPYPSSPLFRSRQNQKTANPANWVRVIEGASNGDEILLEDGTYRLDRSAVRISKSVTIRSASGNRAAVKIQGPGYETPSEGLMIVATGVTIADLTITGMRNHGISIKGEHDADGTHVYNVHLYDIGTQHIKGTPGTSDGVVACSTIGYSPEGVRGDYINGIDIHGAANWTIRDNDLYNIWGDGTGCNVDKDCGRYLAGGGPAILLWNKARENVVERNRVIDCFRGIALGFTDNHQGGVIRNNFVFQSVRSKNGVRGDAGISVVGKNIAIDHNTVLLGSEYRGAIEILNSSNLLIRNNLLNTAIWNRGNSNFFEQGNKTDADLSDLVVVGSPQLHPGSDAIDFKGASSIPGLATDFEGDMRSLGSGPDAGCDESNGARPDSYRSIGI